MINARLGLIDKSEMEMRIDHALDAADTASLEDGRYYSGASDNQTVRTWSSKINCSMTDKGRFRNERGILQHPAKKLKYLHGC